MQTKVISQTQGVITVKNSTFEEISFVFDLDTMLNWYPLCVDYHYRYSPKNDRLYLVPLEVKTKTRYQVASKTDRVNSEVSAFPISGPWLVEDIRDDNKRVVKLAKELGIPEISLASTYNPDIKEYHKIISEQLEQPVHKRIWFRMKDTMTKKEVKDFKRKSEEEQSNILFTYATEKEAETLYTSGQLRVYVNLIRKLGAVNDFM